MTIRERVGAFWVGERPDRIPYTIHHSEQISSTPIGEPRQTWRDGWPNECLLRTADECRTATRIGPVPSGLIESLTEPNESPETHVPDGRSE